MRLDELKWQDYTDGVSGFHFAYFGSVVNHPHRIWRWDGQTGGPYQIAASYVTDLIQSGSTNDNTPGIWWDLDAIDAQAIMYHLIAEDNSTSNK